LDSQEQIIGVNQRFNHGLATPQHGKELFTLSPIEIYDFRGRGRLNIIPLGVWSYLRGTPRRSVNSIRIPSTKPGPHGRARISNRIKHTPHISASIKQTAGPRRNTTQITDLTRLYAIAAVTEKVI
jgi:hypothetical protein